MSDCQHHRQGGSELRGNTVGFPGQYKADNLNKVVLNLFRNNEMQKDATDQLESMLFAGAK